jgi:hypothetical protein
MQYILHSKPLPVSRDLSISRSMTTRLSPNQCSSTFNISSQTTLSNEWLINVIWWTIESQSHVTLFQTREWNLVLFSISFSHKENSGTKLRRRRSCSQICKSFTHFVECCPQCKVRKTEIKMIQRWIAIQSSIDRSILFILVE